MRAANSSLRQDTNLLAVLVTCTGALVPTFTTLSENRPWPMGVFSLANGSVIVSDHHSDELMRIDPDGQVRYFD